MLTKVSKDTKRKVLKLMVTFKKLYLHKHSKDVYQELDIAFPTDQVHSFANGNISESCSKAECLKA